MRMFMLRRGVEFYCEQDIFGYRKDFIAKVCEENMLDMKLDSIIDYFPYVMDKGSSTSVRQEITINCCTSLKTAIDVIVIRTATSKMLSLSIRSMCMKPINFQQYGTDPQKAKKNTSNCMCTRIVSNKQSLTRRLSLKATSEGYGRRWCHRNPVHEQFGLHPSSRSVQPHGLHW